MITLPLELEQNIAQADEELLYLIGVSDSLAEAWNSAEDNEAFNELQVRC